MSIIINDYCSKCHALTSMTLTKTERNEKNDEGKIFKIITSSYQCNMCNTFVISEDKRILIGDKEA